MNTSFLSRLGRGLKGLWWWLDLTRRSVLNLLLLALLLALAWALLKPGAPGLSRAQAIATSSTSSSRFSRPRRVASRNHQRLLKARPRRDWKDVLMVSGSHPGRGQGP